MLGMSPRLVAKGLSAGSSKGGEGAGSSADGGGGGAAAGAGGGRGVIGEELYQVCEVCA